jgi:predicted amidohydrolase YtcJ
VNASTPDIILFNGTIATQNVQQPAAHAMAVAQGNILAVGSNDDILNLAGSGTEKIDLDGRLVVPGFIDTHIHFYEWALKRQGVKLDDLTCLDDLVTRVHRAAGNLPPGQWIMGQGWNETDWTEPRMPTRESLDRATADHPVLLWRCDLHLAAANSAALALAGIDAGTPDPPEGRIERDAMGKPTGILRELAINLVRQAVAPPERNQVMAAFEDAAGALHRRGVTGIHDVRLMADKDGADAFQTSSSWTGMVAWIFDPGSPSRETAWMTSSAGPAHRVRQRPAAHRPCQIFFRRRHGRPDSLDDRPLSGCGLRHAVDGHGGPG